MRAAVVFGSLRLRSWKKLTADLSAVSGPLAPGKPQPLSLAGQVVPPSRDIRGGAELQAADPLKIAPDRLGETAYVALGQILFQQRSKISSQLFFREFFLRFQEI